MIFTDKVDGIAQRFYDSLRADIANSSVPVTDTDKTAFFCNPLQLFIGKIAFGLTNKNTPTPTKVTVRNIIKIILSFFTVLPLIFGNFFR